jgi:hypothetical protein
MRNLTAIIVVFSIGCSSADGGAGESLHEPTVEASETGASSGFNSDAGGNPDGFVEATGTCRSDNDCNDGDECTVDVCERGEGEFTTGLCGHAPTTCRDNKEGKDGGTTKPPPDTTLPPAVDTTCAPGCVAAKKTFPPAATLISSAPSTCTKGFEINNPKSGTTYTIKRVRGTGAVPLEVQFATYLAPDHIKLVGITATGEYPVVDTCTVQTATYADPTKGGCTRPPDETIRQYAVTLRAGTTALRADFTGVCSPIYLRVRGLCDFDVTPFTTGCTFRAVP